MHILLSLFLAYFSLQFENTENERYAIMYFFNPDCPSCREIAPFIDYLKEEYEAVIYAYNTRNPIGMRFGMQYEIRYVPTLIIQIERGENKETMRYVGIEEIREAESQIAILTGAKSPPKQEVN
jgi:thiol-disulfide isomerase/thioredoxin